MSSIRLLFSCFLVCSVLGYSYSQISDCVNAEVVCGDDDIDFNPNGIGDVNDFNDPDNNQGCLATGEINSAWYYFEIEAFLEENKTKEGVQVTASGLQYQVLTEGNGPKPSIQDVVKVHYHGTLTDGTVFDSSVDRGEPIDFPVGQVVPGWVEALQLMPVGSKYKLFLPSELAYGARGAGANIPPFTTLLFEVELLEIVEK